MLGYHTSVCAQNRGATLLPRWRFGEQVSFTLSDSKIVYPFTGHCHYKLMIRHQSSAARATTRSSGRLQTAAGGFSAVSGNTPAPNHPLAPPALQAFLTLTLSNAADQSRVANPLDRKRFCNDIFVSPEFFACIDVETIYAGLSPEKRDELWRMIAEKRGGVPSSAETKASRSKRRVTIIELPYTGSPAEEQVSTKKGKRVKSENPDGTIFYPPEIRLQTAQFVVRLKQQGVFQHYKSLQSMWEYGQLNCSAPVLQPSNTGWILRIPSLLLTFPRPMTCVFKRYSRSKNSER